MEFTRVAVLNRTPNAFDTDETAAAWLVRLDADTSPATLDLWQQWLREDARHHAAFVRVEQGWRQAECLKSLRPLDGEVREDLLEGLPTAAAAEVVSTGQPGEAGAPGSWSGLGLFRWLGRSRPRRSPGLRGAPAPYSTLAVAVGAATAASLLVLAAWHFFPRHNYQFHQTERGGFERIILPDGSTASLNTNSALRVHFTHHHREILLTRGEALFSVAPDELRPFEVNAGGNAVRALGTSFTVRLRPAGKIEVLVLKGEVTVDNPHSIDSAGTIGTGPASSTDARALLSSGDDAMIDSQGRAQIERVDAPGMAHKLAWIHGQIWFQHCALSEAIAEFNRYNSSQFILADPALAQLHIGGSFATTDPAAFMAALEDVFGIRPLPPRRDAFGTEVIQLVASRPVGTSR
jgi:transmembrane sensor